MRELVKRLMVNTLKLTPFTYLIAVGLDSIGENKGYIERFLEGPDRYDLVSLLLAGVMFTTMDYIFRRRPRPLSSINGFKIETNPYERSAHLYVERGSLTEFVGRFEIGPEAVIFTNLTEDLMCFEPRQGFLGRFRKPRRLEYGEKINFEGTPYLWFGYGRPEIAFRAEQEAL